MVVGVPDSLRKIEQEAIKVLVSPMTPQMTNQGHEWEGATQGGGGYNRYVRRGGSGNVVGCFVVGWRRRVNHSWS